MKAVIDLGTNSFKCAIARGDGGEPELVADFSLSCKLGADLAASGSIGPAAFERGLRTLEEMERICRREGVRQVLCVGAHTLREASNAREFIGAVRSRFGWQVQVLSPEEEARLSWMASASLHRGEGRKLVTDCGGGSIEFTFGEGARIDLQRSLPLGALLLTKSFLLSDPALPEQVAALRASVRSHLEAAFPGYPGLPIIGGGGGVCTMAAVSLGLSTYSVELVQGSWLSAEELRRQASLYQKLDLQGRRELPGMDPDRADIIHAGAVCLREILAHFHAEGLLVSTLGPRHALLKGL